MVIKTTDETTFSFGKLSDEGVFSKSPFSREKQQPWYYNSKNFQHLIDNIADIFGYSHGTITASVVKNDVESIWSDINKNGKVEKEEIRTVFRVNGEICVYNRISRYGKNFMYDLATRFGNDAVVGVIAHEVGHLVAQHALNRLETTIFNGTPTLKISVGIHPHWEELCADYLAGVVLAISNPPLRKTPYAESMRHTIGGTTHPDGFWRVYAIEMGYQWAQNNNRQDVVRILTNIDYQRKLLLSFFENFYQNVYSKKTVLERFGKSELPNYFFVKDDSPVKYL